MPVTVAFRRPQLCSDAFDASSSIESLFSVLDSIKIESGDAPWKAPFSPSQIGREARSFPNHG